MRKLLTRLSGEPKPYWPHDRLSKCLAMPRPSSMQETVEGYYLLMCTCSFVNEAGCDRQSCLKCILPPVLKALRTYLELLYGCFTVLLFSPIGGRFIAETDHHW